MEKRSVWEADGHIACQEIPGLLRNTKARCSVHKLTPLDIILNYLIPV